jgi:RHS repeat-associated protein
VTIPAGVWTQFFVSWADLGNPTNMYRLHFANTVAGAQSTFYIDDIQLTGTTPTVLYSDSVAAGWEDLAWSTTFSKTNTTPAHPAITTGSTAYGYDSHGNTTTYAGQTLGYDYANRHLTTTAGATTVTYTRDVLDRLASRTSTVSGTATVVRYSYPGSGDQASLTLDGSNTITQATFGLPGGVLLTKQIGTTVTGGMSLAVGYTAAGAGIALRKTGTPLVPITPVAGQGISFWAYGAPGGNTVDVQTLTTADIYSPAKRVTIPAGVWTQFFVSWADLGNPTNMYRLHFANTVAGPQSTFYIDDVQLTGTTPTVLYGDAVAAGWEDLAWSTTFSKTNTTPTHGQLEQIWSYPNIHGDIQATSNQSGGLTAGPMIYDPYGAQVSGTALDNMVGNMDYGWLGQNRRPSEHETGIAPVIEMGARIYNPAIGRFLQVDPIEGGTSNDYTYVDDPINQFDLDGNCGTWGNPLKKCAPGRKHSGFLGGAFSKTGRVLKSAGKLGGRCALNFLTCVDNIKLASGPLIVAGLTATVGYGIVAACATVLGCFVAVPLLGTAFVGGVYATYKTAQKLWWGPGRNKIYHELGGKE